MSTSQKSSKQSKAQDPKSFSDHIGELRMRVMWVALAFIVTSALAYQYRDILISIVLSPLGHQKLVYLTPAGGFAFIFQITMYAGAVVSAPVLIYQLYKFVQPALPKKATNYSLRIIAASTLLMIGGVAFGYFVAVPSALHFLTSFADTYVEASLTADSYLNFIVAYVVGLGILFQLPLLLVFWNWMNPMSGKKLLSSQKFIILFAFIAAAMITPTPDPANQAMIAVPIIVIYQIGVIAVLLINRSGQKRRTKEVVSATIEPQRSSAFPMLPDMPVPQPPITSTATVKKIPITTTQPSVVRPAPKVIGGMDGMRRMSSRPMRARAPLQRAEARLLAPQRPAIRRQVRAGTSMDGVSRVFSS